MAGLAGELIDMLYGQLGLYDSLLALSIQKKDSIVRNEVEVLRAITEQENIIIGKIQRAEKKRSEVMKDIAAVMNQDKAGITLRAVAESMKDRPEALELTKISGEFKDTLDELAYVNALNRELLNSALEYNEFSINVLRSTYDTEAPIFSPEGEKVQRPGQLLNVRS